MTDSFYPSAETMRAVGDLEDHPQLATLKPRRRSRILVMQGIYEWLLNQESLGVLLAHLRDAPEFSLADRKLIEPMLTGTLAHEMTLHEVINPFLDRAAAELTPIEHAILLSGTYEIVHTLETPLPVIINEWVEITKLFGGSDGFKYINGILDKVGASIRPLEFAAFKNKSR
jgi:N utilization substance protein B